MFDFSDSPPPTFDFPPTFAFPTTFDYLPHLSFRLLLFRSHICLSLLLVRSHICFSDDFCFAQFIRRNFFPSGRLLHSFSTNLRFTPIFVLHQSSLYTNLRLRIFHTLVPHNLVYPELFFVPMSISTVEQDLSNPLSYNQLHIL